MTGSTASPTQGPGSQPQEAGHQPQEPRRSRRDVLRFGGAAALAGLLGILGRPLPVSAAKRKKDEGASDDKSSKPSGKTTTVQAEASPVMDVRNTSSEGEVVALQGTTGSPDGVGGMFVASGGGTAVEARADKKGGTALRTKGRLQFAERSGVAQVSGGAEFVIPVAGGLSEDAFVLATLQDHEVGVHVVSASVLDADEGLIVVRLSQALPKPGRVGWIVLG